MKNRANIAFIDGQNLHLGTTQDGWKVDLYKFRVYLRDKYNVDEAHYFLGFIDETKQSLYTNLQKAGFIVVFKNHNSALETVKKGNVDTDIVFEVMKILVEGQKFDKVILVSGDGDYIKLVDYLIQKDKFEKILFPNRKFASSLYKHITVKHYDYLENTGVRSKIEYLKKKKGP